jgi:hypothetical protein
MTTRKKNNHKKKKNKFIKGGDLEPASGFECFVEKCYVDKTGYGGPSITNNDIYSNADDQQEYGNQYNTYAQYDTNNLPPPQMNSNSTLYNDFNKSDPPFPKTYATNNIRNQRATRSNASNYKQEFGNANQPPLQIIGKSMQLTGKPITQSRSNTSINPNKNNRKRNTVVGSMLGTALNMGLKSNPYLNKLHPDLQNTINTATSNISLSQAISGARGIQAFSQGDMDKAFTAKNVDTIFQGVGNIARQGAGGKKRKSKKRTNQNKNRKTNKKRSNK